MRIQAFREDEVAKIYKSKLIYSIIKYNGQNDNYKEAFNSKYLNALSLNNSSFDNDIFDDTIDYLNNEKNKYNDLLNANQPIIDMIADEIVDILIQEAANLTDDKEKCRFLVEYIVATFKYDDLNKKYHRDIPFGEDYNFEFYNGIPISKSYKGLLVTKTGLSDSIANLLVYLGNELDLKINTVSCTCNDNSYMINSINIDGDISYIDISNILNGNCEITDAFLVDLANLNKYASFTGIIEEGINQIGYYNIPYNFTNLITMEKRILPKIEYIENNTFTLKKTS